MSDITKEQALRSAMDVLLQFHTPDEIRADLDRRVIRPNFGYKYQAETILNSHLTYSITAAGGHPEPAGLCMHCGAVVPTASRGTHAAFHNGLDRPRR